MSIEAECIHSGGGVYTAGEGTSRVLKLVYILIEMLFIQYLYIYENLCSCTLKIEHFNSL